MSVLVLALRAPLQSWGSSSRFARRQTEPVPTKSGIVGLLAAAQGRRRTDPIEDLVGLTMAARADQPGRVARDFQTAIQANGQSLPLTYRYYLADAAFTAYVEGPDPTIAGLAQAIRRPEHPLYLGRRSCPPSSPILVHIADTSLAEAVRATPWAASSQYRRSYGGAEVTLDVQADTQAFPDIPPRRQLQDLPLSFNPERREYGTRAVVDTQVTVPNPERSPASGAHDPMMVW